MIKLAEIFKFNEQIFWITTNRKIGISFFSKPLDIECISIDAYEFSMETILKSLNDRLKMRVHLFSDLTLDCDFLNSRFDAIQKLGRSENNIVLSFEMEISLFNLLTKRKNQKLQEYAKELLEIIPVNELKSAGFELFNLDENNIKTLLWDVENKIDQYGPTIDNGFEKIGILKLLKPLNGPLNLDTLTRIKDKLPQSFEIHIALKKLPSALAKVKYSQAAKREQNTNTTSGQTKALQADIAASGIELSGDSYFTYEWHLILKRTSEELLKKDLKLAYSNLQGLADFSIETIGCVPSYISTIIGSNFHFNGLFEAITEKHSTLICYLPLLTYGVSYVRESNLWDFSFHRPDFSFDIFNHFGSEYNNSNLNIIGQSGKGKSVLINRKIYADSLDDQTSQIIVDVKGSHTRLVHSLNGEIYNIALQNSSGIEPFKFLNTNKNETTLEILKTFVSELCLDEEEYKLNEIESSQIEESLIAYVESRTEFSLDSFIGFLPDSFSRKAILKKFSSKGLLKHVFNSKDEPGQTANERNRIRYYNFQNINTASNSAISRAIMASIMADFSFTLSTKEKSEKLIFVSDETPFFIKHCFRSFSLLSKNVRALNGSLTLTVQVSSDLVVNGNKSLIDNSASHIFLSGDEDRETFSQRFNLTKDEVNKIFNLSNEVGKYSQFIIKDPLGCRTGNLILTKKEYWEATTRALETHLIERLKAEFSELNEELILDLLATHEEFKEIRHV